jgi:hypothetical protein
MAAAQAGYDQAVKLPIAVLGLYLAAVAPASAQTAQHQVLSISLHGDGARATQLSQYDPSVPLSVEVTDSGHARIDELAIVAQGPNGESLRTPLARGADSAYRGSLTLDDQGMWRVHLSSRVGTLRTDTTPVTLDVETPPPSNAWMTGLAVGAAVFLIVGLGGFFVLRRAMRSPRARDLGHVA